MKARVVSAIIALVLVIAVTYIFGMTRGMYGVCFLVTLGCLREYTRLAFKASETPLHLRIAFFCISLGIFGGVLSGDALALVMFVLGAVIFLTMALMTVQRREDLPAVLTLQSTGLLGFLYCAVMPALATRLLQFDHGYLWLFGLMGIVFSGDTMAFLVGRKLGHTHLLEAVSPKKTIEGAVGGLIGSGIAGLALSYFLPDFPAITIVSMAIITAIFGQIGDLFESLLKRVADVKDSGSIMPGHGGILDRVDGIYFAAPVYFILVRFLST